jgi:small subunit ribosomal protein S16
MRIGAKQRPFYRVVAVDERNKRTGGYLEVLGTYNPLTHPHEVILKQDRIDAWIKTGAQMSNGFLRIIGKAPQRPERKAKRDKGQNTAAAPTPAAKEEAPAEKETTETPEVTETPVQEPTETIETPAETVETPTEEAKTEEQPVAEETTPEKADEVAS